MTTLSRRTLLSATGAVSLASVLAACADTGADGQAVSSGGGRSTTTRSSTPAPSPPTTS